MDAFEQIVAMLLKRQGYWVETSYKVSLTPGEKKKIGCPSSPRREIDIVAYNVRDNEILAVECKSFLDSAGVSFASFSGQNSKGAGKYKMFTDATLRKVVLKRLKKQLVASGQVSPDVGVQLCLAAGHTHSGQHDQIEAHCEKMGWRLFAENWFAERIKELLSARYENDMAIMAVKLMARLEEGHATK
jgi:hypothetical protein